MGVEQLKQEIAYLVGKNSVKTYSRMVAREVLEPLAPTNSQIEIEAEEALSVSTEKLLVKANSGDLALPENVHNSQAFLMAYLKNHLRHYLLKRYARRSSKKPNDVYERELETHIGSDKPSRYMGTRFEAFDEDGVEFRTEFDLSTIATQRHSQKIDDMLAQRNLKPMEIKLIQLRARGLTFGQIGELTNKSEDAIRMRFERAMTKARLDKKIFN